jgi:hypothetical protein
MQAFGQVNTPIDNISPDEGDLRAINAPQFERFVNKHAVAPRPPYV